MDNHDRVSASQVAAPHPVVNSRVPVLAFLYRLRCDKWYPYLWEHSSGDRGRNQPSPVRTIWQFEVVRARDGESTVHSRIHPGTPSYVCTLNRMMLQFIHLLYLLYLWLADCSAAGWLPRAGVGPGKAPPRSAIGHRKSASATF